MIDEWEAIAADLLLELGSPEPPVDAYELARDCGFDVFAGGHGSDTTMVGDRVIQLDETLPMQLRQMELAFALGRWALHRAGVEFSERGAEYIGVALLLCCPYLGTALGKGLDFRPLCKVQPLIALGMRGRRLRRAMATFEQYAPRRRAKAAS